MGALINKNKEVKMSRTNPELYKFMTHLFDCSCAFCADMRKELKLPIRKEVKMLKVEYKTKDELPEEHKKSLSENGSGSEYATYLIISHNDKIIRVASDAMEPEDAIFSRDLNWIKDAIENVYKIGQIDAHDSIASV